MRDLINWECKEFKITKYKNEKDFENGIADCQEIYKKNLVTKGGLSLILKLLSGDSGSYALNKDNTYIAIGNGSSTEATISDNKLSAMAYPSSNNSGMLNSGSSGNFFAAKVSDISEVTISDNASSITFTAKFNAGEGSFDWEEWAIYNGNPGTPGSGRTNPISADDSSNNIVMVNHKIERMGTKTAVAVWVVDVTIKLSNK